MPTFCRHNRFIQNCAICREPQAPKPARALRSSTTRSRRAASSSRASQSALRVRRVEQAADDGYRCELVPGVKATADAERLADEVAFATARLNELETDPPEIYATIGAEPDAEEALWLAFLTAYLSPVEGEDPFIGIREARVPWSSGELPSLDEPLGPRTSHDVSAGERTVLAYRAWARRGGGQATAFAGDAAWTPERRFDRLFERLALPGFGRAGRYELLVMLGRLGVAEVRPGSLQLTDDSTTVAAKRVFGIGDRLLLERRARELVDEAEVPIAALDVALFNWAARPDERATLGSRTVVDDAQRDRICAALDV